MVSKDLTVTIIASLDGIPELQGKKCEMPWVPDRVMPAAEIHELLRDWISNMDTWSHLMSEADECQYALSRLKPVAAYRRVVGL